MDSSNFNYVILDQDVKNQHLLMQAAQGSLSEIHSLLQAGAEIYARDENRSTPLIIAAKNGHTKVVEFLLTNGADINAKNKNDKTALIIATDNRHSSVAELLISKGADLNIRDTNNATALISACKCDSLLTSFYILTRLSPEQIKDEITNASTFDKQTIEKRVALAHGCMNKLDNNLYSILSNLICEKQTFQLLGLDLSSHFPIWYRRRLEMILQSMQNTINAHKNLSQAELDKKIFQMIEGNNLINAYLLLEAGANVNARNINNNTPLMMASFIGDIKFVKLLILYGAALNAKNNKNETAIIMTLLRRNQKEIAHLLIEKGADLHVRSTHGTTAFTAAVSTSAVNLDVAFHILTKMSLEQMDEEIENDFHFKNEGHLKNAINEFKKLQLENRNKLFSIFGPLFIKDNVDNHLRKQDIGVTLFQLAPSFPRWYQDKLKDELKLIIDISENLNRKWIEEEKLFSPLLDATTLQEWLPIIDKLGNLYTYKNSIIYLGYAKATNILFNVIDELSKLSIDKFDDVIKRLLKENIDFTTESGETLLMTAVQRGSIYSIAQLIKNGANTNVKNKNNDTALSLAVRSDQMDIAFFLLDAMTRESIDKEFTAYPQLEAWLFSKLSSANKETKAVIIKALGKRFTATNQLYYLGVFNIGKESIINTFSFLSSCIYNKPTKEEVETSKEYLPSLKRKHSDDNSGENARPVKKLCTENEKQIAGAYRDIEMNNSSSNDESEDETLTTPAVKSCNRGA